MSEAVKSVRREYNREYRKKNAERLRAYKREWQHNNPDKQRQYNESYWTRKAAQSVTEAV